MSQRFDQPINASTRYCAVYGHPVKHSASPAMQNAALAAMGLNWRYLAFDVQPEHLREAIAGARRMRFVGLNLTVPHKLLAMEMVDTLADSAREWGAVNTIRFEGRTTEGAWKPLVEFPDAWPDEIRSHGFNTDADAMTQSVLEDLELELKGLTVMLLGAGGAGRVAALKLASASVKRLFLVNRTQSKAEELQGEIQQRFPHVEVIVGYADQLVDLLINATSLGLHAADPLPLDPDFFNLHKVRTVYDMIYRPAETPLLARAKAAGCQVANGLGMLLYQGAAALELWTQRTVPIEIMRVALKQNVYA